MHFPTKMYSDCVQVLSFSLLMRGQQIDHFEFPKTAIALIGIISQFQNHSRLWYFLNVSIHASYSNISTL
jgi:hypothetical protein